MIIVAVLDTAQEVQVFVREHTGTSYSLEVIDESLNDSTTSTVTGSTTDGLLTIDVTHDFVEGRFYGLKISRSGELINFSKIYATDQTDYDKYTVLDGYYTQPTKAATEYVTKPSL